MSRDEVVFLLGAGASVDAGLPLASQLTERVVDVLAQDQSENGRQLSRILGYVIDKIAAHGNAEKNPSTPDIEAVVSTVELLQDRRSFELAPFVDAWDPSADEIASDGWRVNLLLQAMYAALVDVLALPADRGVEHLRPLVSMGSADNGITVATLNYDLTVEHAALEVGTPLACGVDRWEHDEAVTFPQTGVRLMKLHGSLDWVRGDFSPTPGRPGVSRPCLELRPAGPGDLPFLVFGRREKLRPAGPFLALRSEFRERLRQARCLVVVGYSFADAHVNELVAHWIDADSKRNLVVVDPCFPTCFTDAVGFTRQIYGGLSRAQLIGPNTVGGRLWVLRERAASALPVVCHASATKVLKSVQAKIGRATDTADGKKG